MKLKFRCWNDEQMISPDYVNREGVGFWKENSIPTMSKNVMLWTGLLDKNGVEIYEGDIVRILYTDWCSQHFGTEEQKAMTLKDYKKSISSLGVVEWETSYYTLTIKGFGNGLDEGKHGEKEVIGNIYENKELLKGGNDGKN